MMEKEELVKLRLIPYNLRLLETRKRKGFTQRQLGELTGFSIPMMSHIETLRIIPNREAQEEIASALDVDPDWLFPQALLDAVRDGLFGTRVVTLEAEGLLKLGSSREVKLLLPPGSDEDDLLALASKSEMSKPIREVLLTLNARERNVLEMRFGLDDGRSKTLEEVGRAWGVTKERIRQIEAKALRLLRHPSRSRRLKDLLE